MEPCQYGNGIGLPEQLCSNSKGGEKTILKGSGNGCTVEGEESGKPIQSLADLQEFLKSKIPDEPSAQYVSDAAHELIDKLNAKRKTDTQLIEQFRQAMETQTAKMIEQLEQHMYKKYDMLNSQVDEKLQKLFTCVNRIIAAEGELENFRESLRMLYQEMHDV